jgi:hypothetical protein
MGHRISDAKGGVRDSKMRTRAPRDLHQMRALLDPEKSDLRRHHGGSEDEFADAAAYVENVPGSGIAEELRSSSSDSHRRPESPRDELDCAGEDRVEFPVFGVLQKVVHGAASEKHRPFHRSFSEKQRHLPQPTRRTLGWRQKGPVVFE